MTSGTPAKIGITVLKLAVASLLVGFVLSVFDLNPQKLLENFGQTVVDIFQVLVSMVEWTVPYILLGAVLVVPIWLVVVVLRLVRARQDATRQDHSRSAPPPGD